MAHSVINGAGLHVSTSQESLPELAFEASAEMLKTISILQRWLKLMEPLESLQPRD